MTTYKVADLMERLPTDVRRFGMGASIIQSIIQLENGDYMVNYTLDGVAGSFTGGDTMLLSVTPIWTCFSRLPYGS